MPSNSVPLRTCVSCRKKIEKTKLIRLVKQGKNSLVLDTSGCMNGRGAYVCRQTACWQDALEKNKLDRALKLAIKPAEKEQLKRELETLEDKE